MRVAILQSNYIPWKGYFDLINSVDHFVLYDDMQYTRRDWRNRNKIQTPNGLLWLTIPVEVKGKYFEPINQIQICGHDWASKHWKTISQFYSKAPYFKNYAAIFENLYNDNQDTSLSRVNLKFIKKINDILGINTEIHSSSQFQLEDGKSERLLGICKDLNASTYLSGPAAKDYLDPAIFNDAGINIEWMDYSGYKQYNQLYEPFEHGVSILDLLFNEGPNAKNFMKSFNL